MKKIATFYGAIASPWLCVTVYLWGLELRAVIGTDSEPVAVWLADCGAILLTLAFWALVFSFAVAPMGALVHRAIVLRCNRVAAQGALVAVTALYFLRWLLNWQFAASSNGVPMVLLILVALLGIWAVARRKQNSAPTDISLPALEDCFYFGALPVLLAAILWVGVWMVRSSLFVRPQSTALAGTSVPHADLKSRPNIILVVADALRAQSTSLYGYQRETTPHLDRWARSSTVYLEAHSNSTRTQPSITTILTGKHPFSHGRLTKVQPPYRSSENLLQELRAHGYSVAAVTSNEDASLSLLGFDPYLTESERRGFEFLTLAWLRDYGIHPTPTGGRMYLDLVEFLPFLGYPKDTSFYGFANVTLDIAKSVIPRLKKPFFLFVHLHEPHDPYDAPAPIRGMFSGPAAVVSAHRALPSGYYQRYRAELQNVVDSYRDQYDESIRFLDEQLGEFFAYLEQLQGADNMLLMFTADHGESFERGFMNHGADLYESSTHVPLVIRFPRRVQGGKLPGLAQSIDIAPTVLSAAGISVPPWMDGHALSPDKAPETVSAVTINFQDPVGQETFPLPTKLAIWSERYKMILSCDSGQAELYNLANDPRETVDLAADAAEVAKDLKKKLRSHLEKQLKGPKMSCPLND